MAGKYYTLQEAMEKLGKSEDQIKDLVKEGTLRQYLDKGQPLFDQTQVDALAADQQGLLDLTAAGTDLGIQLEETAEIQLEPDEESSEEAPKKEGEDTESEGGFGLSMAGGDLTNADTRASSFGINVLDETDDGYKLASDTKGETSAGDLEEIESLDADANLESVGSGSGLLDLSLQADDTSLGAVLDDILPAAGEGGAAEAPAMEEAGGLLDDIPMAEAPEEEAETIEAPPSADLPSVEPEPAAAPTPSGPSAQLVAMAPVDPATTAYGFAMMIPFIALIIAAVALGAGLRQISPGLLNLIARSTLLGLGLTWWIAAGLFVLMLIALAVFSAMFGEKKAATADVYQKPKKEKKAKKPKPKKEKKQKK